MNFTRHKITYHTNFTRHKNAILHELHTPHDHTPQEHCTNISDTQRAKRAQRDLNPRPSD